MTDWQTIETAPKDGSDILIVRLNRVRVGFWRPKEGRWGFYGAGGVWAEKNNPPTHWMPLPEPPK
jgi:hypothetical protein